MSEVSNQVSRRWHCLWTWHRSRQRGAGLGRKMRTWGLAWICCDSHDAGKHPWKQRQITLGSAWASTPGSAFLLPTRPISLNSSHHWLWAVQSPGNNQERPLAGYWRKNGPGVGKGELSTKWLLSSPISRLSSQPWPQLMNLREQSCLLFVCHCDVFWMIKIYTGRRV